MAAGVVLNALPAILHNTSVDRHEADARIAANTTSLHCRRLVEPGWIDPDVLDYTFSCSVSHCADFQSIYVSSRAHRSLLHHLKDHDVVDTKGITRQRKVSFVREPEVRLFSAEWSKDPSLWIRLSGLDKAKRKRTFSDKIYQPKETTQARSRRSAIARALSLAMLLGLPAHTSAGIAGCRSIVDTACRKDMLSDKTFTESFLRANSNKRNHLLRMQTANGIATPDKEVTY